MIDSANPPNTAMEAIQATPVAQAQAASFNYASLDPAQAEEARRAAERIRGRLLSSYIDTGADLIKIKDKMEHGAFGDWVKAEFGFTGRTAENFMNAARLAQEYEIISELPPTIVYLLAAPSAPAAIVADVLAEAKKGIVPRVREIKTRLAEAIKAQRRADADATERPELVKRETEYRHAAEKIREKERKAETIALETSALAAAQPAAQFLFDHLGARGVRTLFNMNPDWPQVQRHFQLPADTGCGLLSPLLSEAEIEAKFGHAISDGVGSAADEFLSLH